MILDADLSQIEWRVAAFLSRDKIMCDEIRRGIDQHDRTCIDLMELELTKENRTSAKNANFRLIYANPKTSWFGFYRDPNMPDFPQGKWKVIVNGFFEKYVGLAAWHVKIINDVQHNGYLRGPTGRYWTFKKHVQKEGYLDYNTNQIRNYPVQGMAGDIIKLASIMIRKRTQHIPNQKMIMIVHDDIVFDLHPAVVEEVAVICIKTFNDIPILLEKAFNINFDLPIDGSACLGKCWGDVKEIIL